MKKLAPIAFAAIAIGSLAADYNESFNTLLYDGKFDMADSVLQKWIGDRPDDPELYPARFNLLLGRAYNSMIALYRPGEGPDGRDSFLRFYRRGSRINRADSVVE